jgi:hypothetical protein
MKSSRTALVATAIPLLLTSLRVTAGEVPFNAPMTESAQQSAPLLHQTARALHDSPSPAALRLLGGKQISNLWLLPTADANTVFARYNLSNERTAEHLAVLTVRGNSIVASRELTSPSAELVSSDHAGLHWTAVIGTGDTARGGVIVPSSSNGVAALPHWTANIGTGTAANSATTAGEIKVPRASGTQPVAAAADWTSRIGTGHAADSTSPVRHPPVANAR